MISRTVLLIWLQGQCACYNIDSVSGMISRTVRLLWYRQCIWYDIKDSAPDMILRTVLLIWLQGHCACYDIDSVSGMMSRKVLLIWHQGQCAWYDIKVNHSSFHYARQKKPRVWALLLPLCCSFSFPMYIFICIHSCATSRKTDLPLYW